MKKFFVAIILALVCFCGCSNKDYCKACEDEISDINYKLVTAYEMKDWCFSEMTSGNINYEGFISLEIHYNKYRDEIEELENERQHYEMEIKKYSKNWKFSELTLHSYEAVDAVSKHNIYIYEKDGVTKEFSITNLPDSSWTFVDAK